MSPITLSYLLLNLILKSDQLFAGFSQLVSLFPGKTGSILRAGFYRFTMSQCHENAVIGFTTIFSQRNTNIDKGVYIGPQCNIGKCSIAANTLVGSGVHIMSGKGQHNFDDLNTPIKDQGGTFSKIDIGEDCWIGNNALIMANIGNHSVIAAGSVVIDDIPDYAIAVGNPAKVIKIRNK